MPSSAPAPKRPPVLRALRASPQVRFFERVKIERHIAALEKAAQGGSGLGEEQQAELARWRQDLLVRMGRVGGEDGLGGEGMGPRCGATCCLEEVKGGWEVKGRV